MNKKRHVFFFVIISVIILSLFVLQNSVLAQHRNGASDDAMPAISSQDIEQGWYYGSLKQKKPGTPDDWVHDLEGSRSACWYKPGVQCVQGKPESLINSFDECVQAGYGIMESYPRQCRTPDGRLFTEDVPPRKHPRKQCANVNEMCGGIAGIICCPGLTCKYGGSYPDAGGICTAQTSTSTCEPGKEYKNTAVEPVTCNCPEDYEFKVVELGWGPCPHEGMSGCPASVLKCVSIK